MKRISLVFVLVTGLITGTLSVRADDVVSYVQASSIPTWGTSEEVTQTGILELDETNRLWKAQAYPLGNNRLKLIFAEPLLLSTLKAAYSIIDCVESIEQYYAYQGKKGMHQLVAQAILKLKNDAYQKIAYRAQAAQQQSIDDMANNPSTLTTLAQQVKPRSLARYFARKFSV